MARWERIVLALVLLTVAAGTASAQSERERSESRALALSLGGAVASGALVTAAIIDNGDHEALGFGAGVVTMFAPAMGNWYGGERWTRGMTLRVAGSAAVGVGYLFLMGKCSTHGDEGDEGCDTGDGALRLGPGIAVVTAGVLHDVLTARRAVRRRNAALTVVPVPTAHGLSVSVAGTF